MKITDGQFYDLLPDGRALIVSPMPESVSEDVRVFWPDADGISADQRKKIFAINNEISAWSGNDPEYCRKNLTFDFLRKNLERLQMSSLSLAVNGNCDKGTASLFIEFLIAFCLEHGIQMAMPMTEYAEDLEKFTYSALLHKRCLICGLKADIHHVDQIGMGYNRKTKPQIGDRVMPMCRVHHDEYHRMGLTAFEQKYHTKPVLMDKRIAEKYGIKGGAAT